MDSPNMSLYKPILPRFPFDSLGEKTETAMKIFKPDETYTNSSNALAIATRNPSMPLIPPRITPTVNTVMKNTEDPSWYVVISPRETRGLAGPLSISQLKQMYRVNEVKDNTLVWREGETNWQQLVHHTFLRSQLIYLPVLPPRVGSYNEELALFDPIINVKPEVVENMTPLPETTVTKSCFQCGNVAVTNCVYDGEQHVDLFKTRSEVGTNEFASEVLPGFLWVGNASAVKHRSIVTLKFTLIVNCTKNMKNPQSQPPHFRCKFCPLAEDPTEEFNNFELNEIMGMLEKVYDWVEMERVAPENVAKGDAKKPPYHGPTDHFDRPIRTARDKTAFRHQLEEGQKQLEPRVLIWSKYGRERACVVAAAYLMKSYGISAERAIRIIKTNRSETNINSCYMTALLQWQAKYIMGILLCVDCTEEKKKQLEDEKNCPPQPVEQDFYDQCVFLLKNHLPKLIGDKTELALVNNVEEYLVKLRVSEFATSAWSGLVDLDLSDRRLSDRTLAFLFQLLAGTDCLSCIRSIKLRNNYFSVLAARALLVAFYPKSSADPDDDYYLEDELLYPERDLSSLTLLDLSHNP
ncbi:DUF4339 domain-containing protein [archaeon]|nr:MAG: DUF4339 domain-containing protein [archaeon]